MSEKRFMTFWPSWKERTERLAEALDLTRKLWSEDDFFDFEGKYFRMEKTFLYVKPRKRIPIYFSAIGERAAFYAGKHGDHLMTVNTWQKCRDVIFPQFEKGAREAGKDVRRMEKVACIVGGVGDVAGAVRRIRKLHAGSIIRENFDADDPRKIEESQSRLTDETIFENYYLSRTPEELIESIDSFRKVGATQIIYTDFSPRPKDTVRVFREDVIPHFKKK